MKKANSVKIHIQINTGAGEIKMKWPQGRTNCQVEGISKKWCY